MSALLVAAIVFLVLFSSAILGTYVRQRLPEHHLEDDSRHLIEISLGVIGTIAGLVLGLLVASSFGTFQAERTALITLSAKIAVLDRGLSHYGPQAGPAREQLKVFTARVLVDMWGENGHAAALDPTAAGGERLYDTVQELVPKTESQKTIKGAVLGMMVEIAQERWLMYAQQVATMSPVLIGILTFWFAITFLAFGLFSTRNATTITALVLCALAVSGAVFLIEQLSTPFSGAIKISDAPLRAIYNHLGR